MTENRFSSFLNRGAQAVTRKPDFIDQLAVVRQVAHKNVDPATKELRTSIGRRTQDDAFTVQAQYFTPMGGVRSIRLVFPGILAEEALRLKLNKGMQIRFTGLVQAHVDVSGQVDRRPYCVVEKFELVPAQEKDIPGTEEVK
jgi:hypothetical protein